MTKNKVHKLIHSLDKNEKRYLKLYAQTMGKKGSHVLLLFDALARQKVYDEQKLKRKFREQKFTKQLPVALSYLYDLILTGLNNYHRGKSIEEQILEGLRSLKILYKKQLYQQLEIELKKIKQLTIKYDQSFYLPRILDWEIRLKNSFHGFSTKENINQHLAAFKLSNQQLGRRIDRISLLTSFNETIGFPNLKNLSLPLLDEKLDGYNAQIVYYLTLFRLALITKDSLIAQQNALLGIVNLFKKTPTLIHDTDLVPVYANALITLKDNYLTRRLFSKIQELNQILSDPLFNTIPPSLQFFSKVIDLDVFYFSKDSPQGVQTLKQIDTLIHKNPFLQSYQLVGIFSFYAARLSFITKDFDQALNYIEKTFLFYKKKNKGIYCVSTAKILQLLTFYAQQEWLLLPSLLDACKRYLQTQQNNQYDFAFELLFIKKIQQLAQSMTATKTKAILLDIQDSFQQSSVQQLNYHHTFYHFDYLGWIDQQLAIS